MKQSETFVQIIREVMAGWPTADLSRRDTFVRNLIFMHRIIVASERLLETAIARADGALRDYLAAHLEEERRHEYWLAEDLSSIGIQIEHAHYPPEAVAAAGAQYYLINHVDPCALLGYMAVLECFPMPIAQLESLERAHGTALCRTLRHHAMHDVSHGADLLWQIDRLNDKKFQLVLQNAVQTALYIGSAVSKFEVQS